MSFNSSALLFTLTILVKASQRDSEHPLYKYVHKWLNEDNLLLHILKQLVQIRFDDFGKQFLAYDESITPGINSNQHIQIVNSLVFLYNRHYNGFSLADPYDDRLPKGVIDPLRDLSENVYRRCSNQRNGLPGCTRREGESVTFSIRCPECNITIYCSKECQIDHRQHHLPVCRFITKRANQKANSEATVQSLQCDVKSEKQIEKRIPVKPIYNFRKNSISDSTK